MNCGPATHPASLPKAALPPGFKVICSACGDSLDAATQFAPGQLKKKHPRCRACAPNKFKNIKDQGADSRRESKRGLYLRGLAAAGFISNLREQVDFELIPAQRENGRVVERACIYRADFVYNDSDAVLHVEDAKGMRTDVYRLKRKLMLLMHKIRIEEI